MPRDHEYYVYILASRSRTLYIGVTNSLRRRVGEHRDGTANSFTSKYKIHRLVYFERFQHIDRAIAREKYLKHLTRQEKLHSSKPTIQPGKTSPPTHFQLLSPKAHNPKTLSSFRKAGGPAFVLLLFAVALRSSCNPSRSGGSVFATGWAINERHYTRCFADFFIPIF
jgi:putative endonuclease